MSKYFSQGFEYSLEEVQTAANARNMGLDDYISFADITVEEEEPIDPPKEKDPPKQEQKQQIPDWAWDAAGIVEPTKEPTKTETLLKDDKLQNQEFNMVEEAAMNNFRKAYVDGKFNEWLQSPEQIEAAKKEAKAEELIQQPNIQTALINDNYTVQDIREFANLGIEGLPYDGFSDSFYDNKLNDNISSYDDDSFFQPGVVEQTREALKKSGIYNTFERANKELNSDKRFNYVSDIIRRDNNQITEEELPLKVNDYLISNMVETSNDRARTYLGEEIYNKWDKADAKGKNEILKNVFDSSKVTSLVDANGNFVDASRVSDQQKQKIVEKQVDEIQEYSNMGTQSLLKLFKSAEDDLASLATALVTKGEEGIFDAATLIQKGNELLGDALPFLVEEDDKTLRSDFNDLKFMAKTGIVPKGLSYLPQGESQLVSDYNKALRKLQSIQLAVGLNVDLTKLDRESTSDILFEETEKAFGFGEMTLGINEMQNTLLYAMQDELGFKAKEEEIARLGLPGDIYVKQPKLDDQGNIKRDEDGKIEYDAINYEMIYSTVPGFTKMSMEIAASMYLLGGATNVAKVTSGIGDLAAVGMSRFFSPGVAAQFGKFTGGVLQESVGLVGSNAISSNIFGGEEMPVLSFAAGSQLGHLGVGFLGKVVPKGISRYATENRAFGNVVDFVNKMPGGSTVGGAIKFAGRPVIGTTAIKAGEFTSGLVDVAKGEQSMSELWHHVTDADSFVETYGALLFMSAAHPTQLMNKAVDNFQYDMLKLKTDMPSWNRLASEIGLETKKTGSWTRAEVNKAVNQRSNEIATNPELTPEQAREQIANVKAIGKRLGIKRQIDIQSEKAGDISNWNTTYTNLQRTINSIKAGNKINATDIKNLTDAGIANGGASPVLELQTIGLNNRTATELYKFSKNSYNEAQQFFKDANSKNFKNYVESGLKGLEAEQAKANLKSELDKGNISQAAYNVQSKEVQKQIDLETTKQEILIDIAKGEAEARIKETIDYSEQVKAEGSEIRELGNDAFVNLKANLTGNISNSVGYGFQTTIDGKPVFVINKDAMAPSKGEYTFTSGGKTYVVKGFQGSTLKHEIFHPVFENRFSSKSVEQRARKLAGAEGDIDAARETIIKQDIEYIDQFKERLRELGVFNRVEQEMKRRPGYNELIKNGERSVEIEKEFINEFLELQNEGALNSLVEGANFKNVKADVITELKNGGDVVDYFFTGVEKTPEGKAKVKQAQEAYKELVKEGKAPVNLSEKKLEELAKEYKDATFDDKGLKDLIEQYNNIGLKALGYDRAKGDIPPANAVSFIQKEFVGILDRYDPTRGVKLSTWINNNIRPKRAEFYEGEIGDKAATTSIDSETARQIADTSTPETVTEAKETTPRETERLVSVFEGKEAKAKEKEIIEVFDDVRSDINQLIEARAKGLGGTPKEQLTKVAELLFNVPDGTKISNPSKNVLPTVNLVDARTGKKLTKSQLKKGEKGIIDAKDFIPLRDYFKDRNNLKRFLNVSLPEYNITTPESIISRQGESIDVSRDVVGKGIRLPDKIYQEFYEDYIDPAGIITSPSGRSKGKTTQVKVKRIKPEFRNPTKETLDKVAKRILADVKTQDLPAEYNREIGQLVKGMALAETMVVSSEAKRAKLPAETAAEKQLVADLKSGASKLAMSEKLLPKKKQSQKAKMKEILGEYDFYNPESVTKARNVIVNEYAKIFGPGLLNRMFRDLIPGGGRGEKLLGKQMAIGSFEALDSTKKTAKEMIDALVKKGRTRAEAKKEVEEVKKLEQQYLSNNQTLIENNLILDIDNLKTNIEQQGLKDNPAAKIMLEAFGKGQKLNKLASNLANLKTRKQATELLIEKFKEAYDANPEASEVLREFIYNNKASGMLGKDVALMRGKHADATVKNVYEEHTYPFSSWAIRTMDAITSKNPKVLEGWKKWAAENYYQTGFDLKNVIEVGDGKFLNYQGTVDQKFKRVDGEGIYDSQSGEHPFLEAALNEAFKTGDFSKVPASEIRFFNEYVQLNPNKLSLDGKTYAEKYNVVVDKFLENNPAIVKAQSDLIFKQLTTDLTAKEARERLDEIIKVEGTKEADAAFKETKTELDESGVMNTSEKMTTDQLVEKAKMIDKALRMADRPNAPVKKIRIFDFDDTLATSKNIVIAERGNERIELNAEDFAARGMELLDQGYTMDFSDFNRVTDGGRGPLFKVAEKIKEARGNEDLFVLTARAPESQKAIYEFLKAEGLEFKEGNIIGLGNSTGEAKANWIIEKASEGYNDFYFADDAIQNVKAVKTALSVIDVKSKVQQARLNTSEKMNAEFNEIIEQSSGIDASKVFSDVKAELRGGKKKGQRFFIPPSAEDFQGLLYVTLPKGVKGEKAYKFYQDALLDPYTRAMTNLSTSRVNIMSDFKALKKELDVPKDLKKETESGFTNEQAVRVYLWNQAGEKIPGLSKTDLKELTDIVERDAKLNTFAEQILRITKGDGYSKPSEGWANGTITTDLLDVLNTTKRGKYLDTWQQNVDVIFSKENLNKLEAAYGTKYREAVQNSLTRMKTGSNRTGGGNRLSNQVLDYINNSTGVTMFLNARSALLQTISSANYINWSFNNPYQAGKAFANQPQFWKDFKMLINSDYLKDRRNGLKLNISESEIANAAKTSKNKAKAVLNYLLEKGYAPTKYADSFAIAFGGASYYRNRIKDLMKNQGLSEAEAAEQAIKDWRSESEKSQQSSDPSKISQQQASDLGRVVLQYVNTPMQYARLQKRDVQDIVNKRRMPGKTLAESNRIRVSRIIYYAAIQNLIFNGMQQGLFALGFGDTDISDDEQKKIIKGANGMLDSSLRGLGVGGVTVQVLKNLGIDIYERSQRGRPEYVDAWIKLLEFSPAIKSKLGRFKSAAYPFDNKQKREEVFEKGFALNNPAYESAAKVITATTNIPLDRVMSKTNNLVRAFDDDVEAWMSVAMILGWPEWQLTDKGDDNTNEKNLFNKGFKGSANNPFAKAAKKSKNKNPFAK